MKLFKRKNRYCIPLELPDGKYPGKPHIAGNRVIIHILDKNDNTNM